jgi:hypothetical protein
MRFVVDMRVNNRNAVDNVTVVKATDIHIIKCEYYNQHTAYYLFAFPGHQYRH